MDKGVNLTGCKLWLFIAGAIIGPLLFFGLPIIAHWGT